MLVLVFPENPQDLKAVDITLKSARIVWRVCDEILICKNVVS